MSEYETSKIFNPSKTRFVVNFNGEPYAVSAGEAKVYPKFIVMHMAKHLSNRELGEEIRKLKEEKTENPYRPKVAQLLVYDNPQRRKILYDILGSKELVEECILQSNLKGFIGDMSEYDDYVKAKQKAEKEAKKEGVEDKSTKSAK